MTSSVALPSPLQYERDSDVEDKTKPLKAFLNEQGIPIINQTSVWWYKKKQASVLFCKAFMSEICAVKTNLAFKTILVFIAPFVFIFDKGSRPKWILRDYYEDTLAGFTPIIPKDAYRIMSQIERERYSATFKVERFDDDPLLYVYEGDEKYCIAVW